MSIYYRPIIQNDKSQPEKCVHLGNQNQWFDRVEVLERGNKPYIIPANCIPESVKHRLTCVRRNFLFETFRKPLIMGIVNITPDSFSDAGQYLDVEAANKFTQEMIASGIDIIDIGGESTRPGANEITPKMEIDRIEPVIKAIKRTNPDCVISVDTRKAMVMRRVIELGVDFINDVSALNFDEESINLIAEKNVIICLMHGGLNPKVMQENIAYDNVVLDVYDYLEENINIAISKGIRRENIVLDPGIGFAKNVEHNVSIIKNASLFHSLGCPILFGVSRKKFIGHYGNQANPMRRVPGSIAVALELVRQGVQIIRVHDALDTRQALALWDVIL
jgi:dihydropteroate synthase